MLYWKIGLNDAYYADDGEGNDYKFPSRELALEKAKEYLDDYDEVDIEQFEVFDDGYESTVRVERVIA